MSDWQIYCKSNNCPYHYDKEGNWHTTIHCDLLASHICRELDCPMIDTFLKRYLLSHESDIASGMNDFVELQGVFESMIGREAKE